MVLKKPHYQPPHESSKERERRYGRRERQPSLLMSQLDQSHGHPRQEVKVDLKKGRDALSATAICSHCPLSNLHVYLVVSSKDKIATESTSQSRSSSTSQPLQS